MGLMATTSFRLKCHRLFLFFFYFFFNSLLFTTHSANKLGCAALHFLTAAAFLLSPCYKNALKSYAVSYKYPDISPARM